MISRLFGALRVAGKRMVADWLVVTAACLTILLATVLLAAGPIYADAVTISALQQTLSDAPVSESNLSIEASVFPQHYPTADEAVRSTVADSLAATGADLFIYIEADAYGLTDQPSAATDDIVSFQHFEGIEERATLVTGRWPDHSSAPHETAISTTTADAAGLAVGDVFEVVNRRDATITTTVTIVGTFAIDDVTDAFWFEDDLVLEGAIETPGLRKLGPFVISLETMLRTFTPIRTNAGWRVLPRFENLTVPEVDALRREVATLADDLNQAFFIAMGGDTQGSSEFVVKTGLPGLLGNVDRSLTVTRSSVLALLVQLAILAGYALALTAGLLVDTRGSENRPAPVPRCQPRPDSHLVDSRRPSPNRPGGVSGPISGHRTASAAQSSWTARNDWPHHRSECQPGGVRRGGTGSLVVDFGAVLAGLPGG